MKVNIVISTFLTFFLFFQMSLNVAHGAPKIKHKVIHESIFNELGVHTNKSAIVITDEFEYKKELLFRTSEEAQEIDFEKYTLLLLDMGTRFSGGFEIQIKYFVEKPDQMIASVTYLKPGDDCAVPAAITNPYKFIQIETKKEIIMKEQLVVYHC